jgi:hypothetical protein
MSQQLQKPLDPASRHPDALERRQYTVTAVQAIRLATARQARLVRRDMVLVRARIIQVGVSLRLRLASSNER